jgi:chromosome segregation ATPase
VIGSLNRENEKLRRDVCHLETRIHSEVQKRQTTEEELRTLRLEKDDLQAQVNNSSSRLADLETDTQRHVLLLEEAMPLLEKLRQDVSKQKVIEYT